jgi:hypothetical protein
VCARGFHLDIFELEWLACTPANGSLALDDFSFSFGHDSSNRAAVEPLERHGGHTGASTALRNRVSRSQIRSDQDEYREPGPSLYVISHSLINVLPKHLLQACKCLSLIRTIVIPWLFSQKKSSFLKMIISVGQAGHCNASRMLRLL